MRKTANNPTDNPRLTAALAYARRGWPVIPLHTIRKGCCTCGNPDCGRSSGKHPYGDLAPNGRNDASTDDIDINLWWQTWPIGDVGIVTGRESGLVVLDVDPGHGGAPSLEWLIAEHGPLPQTVQCRTGGGGTHYYFRHPGSPVPSRSAPFARGLDVKGDGGSVVAPPSLHLSGKRYAWVESCSPEDIEVAPLPGWLLTLMQAPGTCQGDASEGKRRTTTADESANHRIPESQRNETLTSLAGTMRRRGMTEAEIRAALLVANRDRCEPLLPEDEVVRIAASVGRYAPGDPVFTAGFPLSDLGNAQRLVARHGRDLRYVPQWGKWVVWDGTRWAEDDTREIERRAKETVLAMYEAVRQIEDNEKRTTLARYVLRAQSESRLRAMIELTKSERGITLGANELDTDPWVLNVRNGTIDLRTGQLRAHRREDCITKIAPVLYDPDAKAPRWLAFLECILAGNAEIIDYVQQAVGYSLTGSAKEQCWFVLHGSGANGKSTFLNVIRALLGERDYARHTLSETLLAMRNSERVRNDLARLQGARFVTAVETEDGQRLAESLVKQLTGEDQVTARYLYREYFEYRPTFKLWLAVNFKPKMRSDDMASWRPIRPIPFEVTIPPDQQDKELLEKLLAELPGILNWAIEGSLAWQWTKGGLRSPPTVTKATEQYRHQMDSITAFIEDECIVGPDRKVSAKDLYREYEEWCVQNGEISESHRRLNAALKRRGFKTFKSTDVRGWRGIGLRDPEPELRQVA